MATWNSANLAGNDVTSDYTQYNNLRLDLTTGKFFAGTGTNYLQVSHDGTDGVLEASAGKGKFKAGSGSYWFYNQAGTNYLNIDSYVGSVSQYLVGSTSVVGNSSGYLTLNPKTGVVYVVQSGVNASMVATSISGYAVTIGTTDAINGLETTNSGASLKLRAANSVVELQNTAGARARLRVKDDGLGALVYCWPSGGVWIVDSA